MGIERRLQDLEARATDANSEWVTPIEVLVHCKSVERYQAQKEGREAPPYTQAEVAALRGWDIETVEGRGFVAELREDAGWQTEGDQALLDSWEEGADKPRPDVDQPRYRREPGRLQGRTGTLQRGRPGVPGAPAPRGRPGPVRRGVRRRGRRGRRRR